MSLQAQHIFLCADL